MIYRGSKLKEISFPLGGIGTGSVGLAGNGALIDWEIFNRPNKGSKNGYSCFAIKATFSDGKSVIKNVAYSEDILATLDCLTALGAKIERMGDSVEIEGIKPTRFYDVQVRVRDDFNVEMHIDTDDANSAGLKNGARVRIINK